MGEPDQRQRDSIVCQAWLLSYGAWTKRPRIGRSHVVMVLAASVQA